MIKTTLQTYEVNKKLFSQVQLLNMQFDTSLILLEGCFQPSVVFIGECPWNDKVMGSLHFKLALPITSLKEESVENIIKIGSAVEEELHYFRAQLKMSRIFFFHNRILKLTY